MAIAGTEAYRWAAFWSGAASGTARTVNDGVLGKLPAGRRVNRFTETYDLPEHSMLVFWAQPMDANGVFCTTPELTAALKLVSHLLAQLAALADRPDANVFVYLDQGRCQQQCPGPERFLTKRTHSRLKTASSTPSPTCRQSQPVHQISCRGQRA